MQDWLPIISLGWTVISGPVIFLAVGAVHEVKTAKLIKDALDEERERSKDHFALKHEVAEMKGYVQQLVVTFPRLEAKLDTLIKQGH